MFSTKDMGLNRLTLAFPGIQEKQYQLVFFRESLQFFRLAFILLAAMYSIFAILDILVIYEYRNLFLLIRFGIVVPLMCTVFLLSFSNSFIRYWQWLTALIFVVGGTGITVMNVLVPDNLVYYAGLMLVFAAGYFFIRLRFSLATLSGWVMVLIFNIGMFAFSDAPLQTIVSWNFFYISINLIGMVAAYFMEISNRRNYYLMHQLDKKKSELETTNKNLENKVLQRTQELAGSEEKYRNLVEEISDVIFLLNKDGFFDYISPAIRRLTGYRAEYYLNQPFSKLAFSKEDELPAGLCGDFDDSDSKIFDFRVFTREQNECWVRCSTRCIVVNGNAVGFRGIMQDITLQKQSEIILRNALFEAKAGDKLKTTFLSNISHEIRTPLNGILGFGELMAQGNLTYHERMEYLEMLRNSTDRLIGTITNYMDISLLSSGSLQINVRRFNFHELMDDLYAGLQDRVSKKAIQTALEMPHQHPAPMIETDDELLRKCINQLIDNAVKFTHTGTIAMGYRLKEGDIEFFIRDTGIGIKPEALEMIFEVFSQEDIAASQNYEGSGLGLSIARGLINMLGGSISVESVKDSGSEFLLRIPANQAELQGNVLDRSADAVEMTEDAVVLFFPDDDPNILLVDAVVQKLVVKTHKANNHAELNELLKQQAGVSLIVADSSLIGQNDTVMMQEIRKLRPGLAVLAVLTYSPDNIRERNVVALCDDFIVRPLKKQVLLNKIKRHLRKDE